jgi:hypothetical protein
MVRKRESAVSNHGARLVASSFETLAAQAPQDKGKEQPKTRERQADFSNNSRPISMRRISLVPAPIS